MKPIIAQIGNLAAKKKAHSLRARDSVRRASDFVQIAIALTRGQRYTLAVTMQIDLHGYHPREIVWNGVLMWLVEQAWEMGERELILIHGHGRNRGITPGFVNTNTGFFGLEIRRALRHDERLRRPLWHV